MFRLTNLFGFGGGAGGRTIFDLTIGSDLTDVDLYAYLVTQGYDDERDVAVTIGGSAQVSSTSTASPGLLIDLSDFSDDCEIGLTIDGEICGKGGAANTAGGDALEVQAGSGAALSIDNQGEINGGGGGGSTGATTTCRDFDSKFSNCTSTLRTCAGGAGGTGYGPNAATGGSAGQSQNCNSCPNCTGGTGSSGGGKGTAGSGGAAGAAVVGDSNISWTNTGTRNGNVS